MVHEVLPWEKLGSRRLADCRIFTVNEVSARSPLTHETHEFYALESADWVNIVPITRDNEVVCVRQFRHGAGKITLEIPGGLVDPGEQPRVAAMRECLEETGYAASELISLGSLAPNPALFSNVLHTWLAPGAAFAGDIQNQSTEHTEVQLVPLAQLPELLISGEIDHALVVATLWRALHLLQTTDPVSLTGPGG